MTLKKERLQELADNIFFVEGEGRGIPPHSNSLLISNEKQVLIDTGLGMRLLRELRSDIDLVINTHCHVDHIRGNHLFKEVWACEIEADAIRSIETFKGLFGMRGHPLEEELVKRLKEYGYHPSRVDKEFCGGDVLEFRETRWEVILTPGHSPGHCCFYEEEVKIVFSGDIDPSAFGPWYGWPKCNIDDFIASIKRLMGMDIEVLVSSHLPPISDGITLALGDYLEKIYNRETKILGFLDKERALKQIVDQAFIYGVKMGRDVIRRLFEENMVRLHLEKLIREGRVEAFSDGYRAV
ncbi:MAG: MBL fold metallo-hydrolase [Nitrososphaeria archaeon]|nr:MBL fold metallo-hydrolase [Nitrososphaeria archaeon]NIN53104.1 MBL fold metallo-hydrolase [Nitrososphaeria archaeon]NIQ33870.1 MBL fold metallo-hydrolase [Nitrososphaeria archaeon]